MFFFVLSFCVKKSRPICPALFLHTWFAFGFRNRTILPVRWFVAIVISWWIWISQESDNEVTLRIRTRHNLNHLQNDANTQLSWMLNLEWQPYFKRKSATKIFKMKINFLFSFHKQTRNKRKLTLYVSVWLMHLWHLFFLFVETNFSVRIPATTKKNRKKMIGEKNARNNNR